MLQFLFRRALLGCAVSAFALALPSFAATQGGSKEDAAVLAEILAGIEGDLELESMPRSVDYRPLMPKIGMQTMNDCAAWAFGYYGRSYLEARNQGWQNRGPRFTFSPSFIYNQVNGGKDEGSNPFTVLELLRDTGAATLQTFPYAANDFKAQPPPLANVEAPAFRIEDFEIVHNGKQMRELLARGEMVVLGVRTNPIFSGGRYPIYTQELHAEGSAQRTDGQPHGYHAMAVGGYDDDREAFLILNSWGEDWGLDGAIWVHYDVAEDFNLNQSTENLIDYGLVMRDSQALLAWGGDHWSTADTDSMRVTVRPEFEGLNAAGDRQFRLHLDLAGTDSVEFHIDRLLWEHFADGEFRGNAVSRLGSTYPTYSNLVTSESAGEIRATVGFRNGTEVVLEAPYEVDLGQLRRVELSRRDAFYGSRLDDGLDAWRWTLMPQMSARDWRDLTKILWYLERDGELSRYAEYQHDGSSDPQFSPKTKNQVTRVSSAPEKGYALVYFGDGTSQRIEFPLADFKSPRLDGPTVVVTHRVEGEYRDQEWYHFDAQVVVPESMAPLVDQVHFTLDGLRLDGGAVMQAGEPTLWPAPWGRAVSGYASADLDVYARLQLDLTFNVDYEYQRLDSYFIRVDGAYRSTSSRSAESGQLKLGGEPVELLWDDSYVGEVDGVPTWQVTQYLRDRTGRSRGLPEYEWPEGVEYVSSHRGEHSFEEGDILRVTGPYEVTVRREDYELDAEEQGYPDRIVTDVLGVAPRSPITDAVSLDVVRGVADRLELAPGQKEVQMVQVSVRGPLRRLETVVGLEAQVPSLAGGWLPAVAERIDILAGESESLLRARVPAPPKGEPTRVRVHWSDGSSALLEAHPRGFTPYPIAADLTLEVIERPWAIEADGLPVWVLNVGLTGTLSAREQVSSMRLWATDESGQRRAIDVDDRGRAEVFTSVPLHFEAAVVFEPDSGRPERQLEAHGMLATRHTAEPLELFGRLYDQDVVEVDPNAWDINAGASEPTMYAFVGLRGWERELRRVRSITYSETDREAQSWMDDYQPQTFEVTERGAQDGAAFAHPFQFVWGTFDFGASVQLEGADAPLELTSIELGDSAFYRPDAGVTSRFVRYGATADGEPTWLLHCDASLSHTTREPNHLLYYLGPGGRPLPPAPEGAPVGVWGVGRLEHNERPYLASQAYPGFPAETVVSAAVNVGFADRFAFEAHHWNEIPALFERSVQCPDEGQGFLPESAGPEELEVEVGAFSPGSAASLQRLGLTGPLAQSAQAASVRYTVLTDTGERTLEPFAVEGFGHERFDVRWLGAVPRAVRAELLDARGETLRTLAWQRGG